MKDWADNLLTEEERWAFDTEGYLLVENALSEEHVELVRAAMDKC